MVTLLFVALCGVAGFVGAAVLPSIGFANDVSGYMWLFVCLFWPAYVHVFMEIARSGGVIEKSALFSVAAWGRALPTSAVLVALQLLVSFVAQDLAALLALAFGIAVWFALDDSPNPISALTGALSMWKTNPVPLLLMGVLAVVLSGVGTLLCFVGLLVTFPMVVASYTHQYLTARGSYVQF